MPNVRIGIQTRSLRLPLKKALRTAARIGADGVEIDARSELPPGELSETGLREFRKLLADLNLRVAAITFPTRHGYDEPTDLERRIAATQAAMQFSADLGSRTVINRVGRVPEDEQDPNFAQLVEVLSVLGSYGNRVGARLAAQTGNESGEQLDKLIAAVPDESIGVDLHPSALIHNGHSPEDAVSALGRSIVHVHACDAVRDLGRGRTIEVELGRGTADFPALLGRLTEFNYDGWVTIERHDAADPVAEIENAVAYLRSL